MKKILIMLTVAAGVTFTACNENRQNETSTDTAVITEEETTGEDQAEREPGAFKEYLELKDALVESNAEEAGEEAENLHEELNNLQVSGEDMEGARAHAQHIASVDNIEEQRNAFAELSQHFIRLAKEGAFGDQEYYVQHCPMALDNKGADWISGEEEIRNPYFGDQMLTCGEVVEEVR